MRIARTGEGDVALLVEGQLVEPVAKFKYLGSLIEADGRCRGRLGENRNRKGFFWQAEKALNKKDAQRRKEENYQNDCVERGFVRSRDMDVKTRG